MDLNIKLPLILGCEVGGIVLSVVEEAADPPAKTVCRQNKVGAGTRGTFPTRSVSLKTLPAARPPFGGDKVPCLPGRVMSDQRVAQNSIPTAPLIVERYDIVVELELR